MAKKAATPKQKGKAAPAQVVKNQKDFTHNRPSPNPVVRGGYADPEGEYLSERLKRATGKASKSTKPLKSDEDGK